MKRVWMMCAGLVLTAGAENMDLRGLWTFDDGTGTQITDASGNGNIGFAQGVKWDKGVNNAGLLFNSGGFVNAGNDSSLSPAEGLTVEAWVKMWNLPYKNYPEIITKKGSYAFRFAPGGKLSIELMVDGQAVELTSRRTEWPNSVWTHVAATYDGETLALYTDGVKDAEKKVSGKIDKSRSSLVIGSTDGKSRVPGRMDEVRVAGRGWSAQEVYDSYHEGAYQVAREDSTFPQFFEKKNRRVPEMAVPGFIWIDAEDFSDYGGWSMDTQFVPQMGSPYLLAAGIGNPVKDAVTTLTVPEAGTYRIWVRSKNWLKEHAPGTFKVAVNGKTLEKTFGAEASGKWVWEDGGTVKLEKGDAALALHDLTGFYGRCDAIVLTSDEKYTPPAELQAYKNERARLTGQSLEATFKGDYDVIVVGAGVAGINAAISSARTGAKTALIQDRPMIGGNNSLELGVVVSGPANHGKPNMRESGLNEEIGRVRAYNYHGKWSRGAELVAAAETNLTIFLNTHVNEVEMDGSTIKAVKAFNMVDGSRTRYTAKQFIDCTGDGWLGYYAGAEYRHGREARSEFNESHAPEQADHITMSGCLMTGHTLSYNTKKEKTPQPYSGSEWLWDLRPNGKNLEARNGFEGSHTYGRWWHENVGETDDLWDPENTRDELIVLNLSYWNWIKNYSSVKDEAANYRLTIIPIGNAKRETRRLVGDHILTQDDVLSARKFEDAVATGGWSLDVHHPKGIWSEEGPFDFNTQAPANPLPFRILYSRNINNLLFAGRQVSATHVALGNVRVQGTTGVLGQAVGTAAAMCTAKGINPRELYRSYIKELQQQLIKDDQYIIGLKNEDPADLARHATVSASSFMAGGEPGQVINGMSRIVGKKKNMWMSDPAQPMPQWLELDFGQAKRMNAIYVTLDTDLNDKRHASWEFKESERFVPESIREYSVKVLVNGRWQTVAEVEDNFQRRRIHRFPSLEVSKVRIHVQRTNGDKSARIFEVRAYNE
ncbi:FAD-dependent oxidoreductase [Pontiella agarivorans]|uniref:FAD-dependent oxidoreductase n=1 Tax=Pontiella agarivorans TaxID=3038953 RepID=A0ABU5MYM0_9BACT|nr:FAD-dependent oxidoreductase [Pontiella agarivorans]MDZ8119301.1 FAD-dependent oxidoreductase [Pontiella agarivorans]